MSNLNLEYEVITRRLSMKGETIIDRQTFADLDDARAFVNGTTIAIPPEDQGVRWVKYVRTIRRIKEPAA